MTSLASILQRAARDTAERGFRFWHGGREASRLTYGELHKWACRIAARLGSLGLSQGDRALLVYNPGLDFVASFWGCIYAGVVAVPAPAPHPSRLQRTLPRLRAIAADCHPALLLTHGQIEGLPGDLAPLTLRVEDIESCATRVGPVSEPAPALAMLQYTSGSTRDPRGVMLTHSNLLHNLDMLAHFHGRRQPMVMVHWLPLHHDMGLIRGMLSPVHLGADCVMMDAMEVVQRPVRWLRVLSEYGATVTGAPDFGYALVNRKVAAADVAGLDLSALEVAFCSAEPIRASSLLDFGGRLSSTGFRPGALKPAYGLAEATVMVSGETRERLHHRTVSRSALGQRRVEPPSGDGDAMQLVCCGQPLGRQQVLIVENGRRLPAETVGEIWLRGPSVSPGYWNHPDDPTFQARLEDGEGPFLATGDLGWMDHEGNLTVCGRIKDLVIVRGQNFYPQDIEQAVQESVPSLRPGGIVAFSREDGGVVVVAETRVASEEVARAVWEAAGANLGLSLSEVLLLAPGELAKTASGKVQRRLLSRAHESQSLRPAIHWRAPRARS